MDDRQLDEWLAQESIGPAVANRLVREIRRLREENARLGKLKKHATLRRLEECGEEPAMCGR